MCVRRTALGWALAVVTMGSIAGAAHRQVYGGQHCHGFSQSNERYRDYGLSTFDTPIVCPIVKFESDSVYSDADAWTSFGVWDLYLYEADLAGDFVANFEGTMETVDGGHRFDFPSMTPLTGSRLTLWTNTVPDGAIYSYQLLDDSVTY